MVVGVCIKDWRALDNERTSPKDQGKRCMVDFDVGRWFRRFKGSEAVSKNVVRGDGFLHRGQ